MPHYSIIQQDSGYWGVMGKINPSGVSYATPRVLYSSKSLEEAESKMKEMDAALKDQRSKAREKEKAFRDSLTPEEREAAGLKPKKEPKPKAAPKPRKKKGEAAAAESESDA